MDYLSSFIRPELLVLVPVLYIVGAGLKKSQRVENRYIPAILGLAGVVLATAYVLASSPVSGWRAVLMAAFMAVTQGILCAGASVYVHQIIKHSEK